ncbi:hypothetical protein BDL97_06G088300 [Sphagnum fallax]|nr:hypothetical protein BDL97_06G088300 [Sphagnum fallax]
MLNFLFKGSGFRQGKGELTGWWLNPCCSNLKSFQQNFAQICTLKRSTLLCCFVHNAALLFLWTWNPIQSNGDILGFLTISEKHFTLLKKPKLKLKLCSERLLMRK